MITAGCERDTRCILHTHPLEGVPPHHVVSSFPFNATPSCPFDTPCCSRQIYQRLPLCPAENLCCACVRCVNLDMYDLIKRPAIFGILQRHCLMSADLTARQLCSCTSLSTCCEKRRVKRSRHKSSNPNPRSHLFHLAAYRTIRCIPYPLGSSSSSSKAEQECQSPPKRGIGKMHGILSDNLAFIRRITPVAPQTSF